MKPISEQTILITGATDGLGRMMAERLAKLNAKVLLHGRNIEKGLSVIEEIKRSSRNKNLKYFNADFSSLKEVENMGTEILSTHNHLDMLINNAGMGGGARSSPFRELGNDGYEIRFTVNYLAQVLLTRKLVPIISAPGGRIINVASIGQSPIDFDDLMLEHQYAGQRAYSQSKLALIMFTLDLAEELKEKGITVNTLHPATYMKTNMVLEHFGDAINTVEDGCDALAQLSLSTDMESVTGEYFNGNKRDKALPQAYNTDARAKLKAITERLLAEAMEKV